jgi:hypothetical protein
MYLTINIRHYPFYPASNFLILDTGRLRSKEVNVQIFNKIGKTANSLN